MATVDELTTQLAALVKARGSGVLIVRHGDTQVTYRTMAELLEAISAVQADIDKANGVTRQPRYVQQSTKGY